MRLPEVKIKQALVHPEKLVRQEVLLYFAECFSRDAEVMPLVIKAIDMYGRRNAFLYLHLLEPLRQTEATVEWAIRELHREEDKTNDHNIFFPNVSRMLCQADPQLLLPRREAIKQAPGFFKGLVPQFEERLQLASWDPDQCWNELEAICARGVAKGNSSNVDFGRASQVVEALAPQGEKYIDRILDLLDKEVTDFVTDPMSLLEIFLVELAGEMRLERAIPLIVKKLRLEGEILSEQCMYALSKIGTEAIVEAVTEGWLETSWDYRLYATSALENVHVDATVKKCLELLPLDEYDDIRTKLADALLAQFAEEGIEPVRQMIEKKAYNTTISDLKERLVAVSTVVGVTFPEYLVWKKECEEKQAKVEQRMAWLQGSFQVPASPPQPVPALPPQPAPAPRPRESDEFRERKPTPMLRVEKKVGRNDPCPCGSGKKFKKCCMSK